VQALRPIERRFTQEVDNEDVDIDFTSVGLYLVGIQIVASIVLSACSTVLCCWLLPIPAISAVRTLVVTSFLAIMAVCKPIHIGRPRGVVPMFNCLRPAVAMYIATLVLEQLESACNTGDGSPVKEIGHTRMWAYHIATVILTAAGFARSRNPMSESDGPFLLATVATIAIAVLIPAASLQVSGPLCSAATLLEAGERLLRALLFGASYVTLVYSSAPQDNLKDEHFICMMRAGAGSAWVLAVSSWMLILAPIQVALTIFVRLSRNGMPATANGVVDEAHPLNDFRKVDYHLSAVAVPISSQTGDVETGTFGVTHNMQTTPAHDSAGLCSSSISSTTCASTVCADGFFLSPSVLAAIAAREANE